MVGSRGVCAVVTSVTFLLGPRAEAARIFPPDLEETVAVQELDQPTAFAFGPEGEVYIAGKQGGVFRARLGERPRVIASLAVDTDTERGITGLAVDPDFAANRQLWLYYTTAEAPIRNRLSRFTLTDDGLRAEVVVIDFPALDTPFHTGGCLRFAQDRTLFVSVGDGGNRAAAADPNDLRGKILHINRDGTAVPRTGPPLAKLRGSVAPDARVWARGFRNPWRFSLQPGTEMLFIGDVGERSYEELDLGVAGGDYGWPTIEGPEPTGQPGYVYPIFSYAHDPSTANSITAGDHAKPTDLTPAYAGSYIFGDWGRGHLYRAVLDGQNQVLSVELWATDVVGPVDIQFGPDGALYYLAFFTGELRRIGVR